MHSVHTKTNTVSPFTWLPCWLWMSDVIISRLGWSAVMCWQQIWPYSGEGEATLLLATPYLECDLNWGNGANTAVPFICVKMQASTCPFLRLRLLFFALSGVHSLLFLLFIDTVKRRERVSSSKDEEEEEEEKKKGWVRVGGGMRVGGFTCTNMMIARPARPSKQELRSQGRGRVCAVTFHSRWRHSSSLALAHLVFLKSNKLIFGHASFKHCRVLHILPLRPWHASHVSPQTILCQICHRAFIHAVT